MNEAYNNLLTRRSIRKYRPEQISRAELDAVLEAGKCAPSGRNMQSAIMIVVQDPETVALLSKLNAAAWGNGYAGDPFYGAPTVIVVLAKADSRFIKEDGSLVMGNLMLAAHDLGIGSCWIHRAKEEFETDWGKDLLKSLGINEEYEGIGHCALGFVDGKYPDAHPLKGNRVYSI